MNKDKLDKKLESMPHANLSPKKKEKMLHSILEHEEKEKNSRKRRSGWLAPAAGTLAVTFMAFLLFIPNTVNNNQAHLIDESPSETSYFDKMMELIQFPTGYDLFLLFFIIMMVITFSLSIFIRIKNNIDYEFFRTDRYMNDTHKWVERILLFLLFIMVIITYFSFSFTEIYVLLFGFSTVLLSFRSLMEYKHDREEKEYIISLIWAISWGIIFIVSLFFMFQITTISDVYKDFPHDPESVDELEIANESWISDAEGYLDRVLTKRDIIIKDKQTINQIVTELSDMELRERIAIEGNKDNYYTVYLKEDEIYSIYIFDEYISINGDYFKVVGKNNIYEMLENANLNWNEHQGTSHHSS